MSLLSGHRTERWRPTPNTAIALTALVLAAGGGGYALAAATGDQVITACLDSASGQPTKIITSGSCDGGQTSLSWNQSGPQGVQGPVGPSGKDSTADGGLTVVALPPKPSVRRTGQFTASLQLPAPGTYQIDGHVQWSRGVIDADVPIVCLIAREQPATVLDTLNATVLTNDISTTGAIDERALTTVRRPKSKGPVTALPVAVTFQCAAKSTYARRILFRGWTLSATPVRVSRVKATP